MAKRPLISDEELERLCCSFCGKHRTLVRQVVAGPGVYICNECIDLAADIIADNAESTIPQWESDGLSDEELLARVVALHTSRARFEAHVGDGVRVLRKRGMTWARIGEALGMTRQSAWERYSGEE